MSDQEIIAPNDTLNKLSQALIQISRGDPFVALRNELQTRFNAIDTRLSAMDKATELQHEDMVRVPTLLDKASTSIRELLEQTMLKELALLKGDLETLKGELRTHAAETKEKFSAVAAQFDERDTRTDQRAGDTKLAVDAAFAAAKEATAKIEAGFTKQIDGMIEIINTKTENLSDSIGDIKDRVVALESRSGTTMEVRRDSRDNMGLIFGGIAVLIALVALFMKSNGLH